ncbi:sulfurtransferase [Streptomyces resistomycificus]|uniref:3-mercaptopyruvate sulfurtransferase n=1 Tax=Streptomyces resistomycificus TaxID=67356 RepID=A0A0L8LHY8_9ACTN|nr:sulfurtransferase [Streptomyces resistomycificus]KOG37735.1 3-mercaptopyruvate sulfurtransferase [Streptomyces resistomycificus]KUN90864.1 3-mercaptopyruvate sulfurtransferase [Streptomyces resistomycificus]
MNAIISASELTSDLASDNPPVLLDVRWQLSLAKAAGEPSFDGRAEYAAGHIPGAVYVDLDRELAGPPGAGGRHPLPDVAEFGAAMRRAGVSSAAPVVVYDGGQGWAAARAWWLLRWTGHPDVRVLDGGLPAWEGELSVDTPQPAAGDFRPTPTSAGLLDADGAAALARSGVLLDARAGERYRGDVEPIDRVGGHIPGAVSAPTTDNVAPGGRFLPAQELGARFKALGASDGSQVGVYCGSGVSGAHEVLALAVAGIPAALYVGSWSEWSSDPSRPVAVGPDPQ